MDSRDYFTFILVLFLGAFFPTHQFADGRDFRREVVCSDEAVHLDCGNRSLIAIHEAFFTNDVTDNVTCQIESLEEDEGKRETPNCSSSYEDIRISVNRMCSGNKLCTYVYGNDSENEIKAGGCQRGTVVIRYDCVRENTLTRYCNIKLHQKEGYIASPGYPNYYMKLKECEWGLEAAEGQALIFKVLHLQMRPASVVLGPSSPSLMDQDTLYALGHLPAYSEPLTKCDLDVLSVLEGNVERLTACGESLQPLQRHIEAEGSHGLTVRFKSVDFMPSSGFLAYYKIQGCPTLAASEGSYLLERNGSSAVYVCSNQNVFNDTMENTRFLQCVRDHHWNDTLPPCITEKVIEETTTTTFTPKTYKSIQEEVENVTIQNSKIESSAVQLGPSYLEDILIPSVLIGVLLIGNTIILLIIIFIRRRQKSKSKGEEDEFEEQQKPQNPVNDTALSTV